MANVYGPMQFRPNPSGLTLNSSPVGGFQPPAAAAPAAPQAAPMPSYGEWARQNGKQHLLNRITGGRMGGRDAPQRPMANMGIIPSQVDYLMAMAGQNGNRFPTGQQGGGAAPVQGPLSLDPTALAFMNFLNGRT
jgi:hypothetical protein